MVAIVLIAALASRQALSMTGLPLSEDEYNLAKWEVRHFPDKWLYLLGHAGDGSSREEDNADVLRYLDLQREVEGLQSELSRESATDTPADELQATSERLRRTQAERDAIGVRAQAIMEGRISSVASGLGLETTLPLFSRVHWLFPPVDFGFEEPPYVLVISPRDRIVEEEATLLRSDLALEDAQRLEREAEAKSDNVSALVVPTGGIGTYPAIVEPTDSYARALQTASHEWLHGYLFFQPLGARYFASDTLRTINETVADIVGTEIGTLVEAAYPLASATPRPESTRKPTQEGVDVDRVLRQLRLDVDGLLAQGKVSEAEALMEERRRFLAENGHYIRRINQAYFAFYGLYGTSGASSSPIGPKLEELRRRSASLGDFVRAVSGIKGESDLDRLLAEAGATLP